MFELFLCGVYRENMNGLNVHRTRQFPFVVLKSKRSHLSIFLSIRRKFNVVMDNFYSFLFLFQVSILPANQDLRKKTYHLLQNPIFWRILNRGSMGSFYCAARPTKFEFELVFVDSSVIFLLSLLLFVSDMYIWLLYLYFTSCRIHVSSTFQRILHTCRVYTESSDQMCINLHAECHRYKVQIVYNFEIELKHIHM